MQKFKPLLGRVVDSGKRAGRWLGALSLYAKVGGATALAVIIIPAGLLYNHHRLYSVKAADTSLASKASVDVSAVKATAKTISYNAADAKPAKDQNTTVAGPADATGKTGYKTTINTNFKQGMSFGDSASDLGFTLTPLFNASAAQYKNGQVMFPISGSTKVFQTFKKNGVKEDIILTKAPARTMSWQWKLGLNDKLSAKLMPDGSVGVFAADPNLYGNIQVEDDKTKALVDKARTADKTYEIFTIPTPFIKNAKGQSLEEDVSFKLVGDTLTLTARNLRNQHYPISIDPSVVVTTTADFTAGNDDGSINYSAVNQISRGQVSLGAVGATTQQTNSFTTTRTGHSSVAYNGFLYVIGGTNGSDQSDIQFSSITSAGALACPTAFTCATGVFSVNATGFTTARHGQTSVAYNGYLYIIGGSAAGTLQNDIQHCPLNADGSVGTCVQQAGAFTTARFGHTSVVYNGFLYVIGGCSVGTCTTFLNDIQHLPINADGSVGATTSQAAAFTTARYGHTSVAYNGYLYVIGGCSAGACTSFLSDIQHIPINSDGSVGTTVSQAAAFTTARWEHTSVATNGYLYVIGGCTAGSGTCSTFKNDVQYLPINADGSVGATTSQAAAFTTARNGHTSVAYNGFIYIEGGCSAAACTTYQNDSQRLPITTGAPSGFGTLGAVVDQATAFTGARGYMSSVAYNGFIYLIGGFLGGVAQNDIQFSSISSSGALVCPLGFSCTTGVFHQQTAAFTTARWDHTSVVYNGYLYIIGGNTSGGPLNDVQHCPIAANGSVGACTQQTTAFASARSNHSSVVYNGFVYIIGGCSAGGCTTIQNDIEFASINTSTGALVCPTGFTCTTGVFTQQNNAYLVPRWVHSSEVYNGYLYILGGCTDTSACSVYENDIEHCVLNANGSVGTCVDQANAYTTARWSSSTAIYDGYIYVMGGADSSFFYPNMDSCPINSDGSVGACSAQTSLFTARADQASVAYNGFIYASGSSNGPDNDVMRFPIHTPPQQAHYEKVVNIGRVADSLDSISYNGTSVCGVQLQYATADGTGVFGALTSVNISDLHPGLTFTLAGQTFKQYIRLVVTLNDQNCGGSVSTVTDITVNYSLPPEAPTLSTPASGAVNVGTLPVFTLKSTHASDVYTRYKIIVYQSNCSTVVRTIDETASQTGWSGQDAQASTAYVIGSTLAASTLATHTYQAAALSANTTYCWKAAAIDPAGTNNFGAFSATQLFSTNQMPSVPTLVSPTAGQIGVSTLPVLRVMSTDADSDYILYKIDVCSVSNCSTIVRTIDETASQTGWISQSLQSATAYSTGQEAVHDYQAAALSANTQYWWRAYAIDPGGNNAFTAASAIGTFTTQTLAIPNQVHIGGSNVNIGGNVVIKP